MNERNYAVVVCGYNEMANLPRCLDGLIHTVQQPSDLIFVDDASTDGSFDWVARKYPGITLVRNENNKHYTGAYNVGIQLAIDRGKTFAVMVNADVEVVNKNFVVELVDAALRLPDAGFIGPKVYYRKKGDIQGTSLFKPTLLRHLFAFLWWRLKPASYMRSGEEEHRAEFINTVCCLVRTTAVRDIGLMDENMGIYFDDAEWMTRAEEKGWLPYYVPIESIIHHEKPVGYEQYSMKTFMLKRNFVYYALLRRNWAEAAAYAWFSTLLASVHLAMALARKEPIGEHAFFLKRLVAAYGGLLARKPLGLWFGPPVGPWRGAPAGGR
jgi:N-acetylglucosaminyl-diphospho-decaprenol L-rhamnosyltransferase